MNVGEDRNKAIILVALVVIALLIAFIQLKRVFRPSLPQPIASPPPSSVAPPPSAPPPASQTASSSAPPANAGGAPAPGATAVPAPGSVAPAPVLPDQPFKIVVRDPFLLTPSYGKLQNGGAMPGEGAASPASKSGRRSSGGKAAAGLNPVGIGLPPAIPNLSLEAPKPAKKRSPVSEMAAVSSIQAKGGAMTKTSDKGTGTSPTESVRPSPEAAYALTGTIDGDVPMAILRSNDRNYLVKEGDWLEGDLQVLRITPRQVILSDQNGRSRVINLGVVTHAS
jgi:hypothetical protein